MNSPVVKLDRFGLDIVVNKTGGPVIVYGNTGHDADAFFLASHGTQAEVAYVLVPDGGISAPTKGWVDPVDAAKAAWNITAKQVGIPGLEFQVSPPDSVLALHDVDGYISVNGLNKLAGDDLGPWTTLTVNSKGEIQASSTVISTVGACIRNFPRKGLEILNKALNKVQSGAKAFLERLDFELSSNFAPQ